jgi:hypothetical protein
MHVNASEVCFHKSCPEVVKIFLKGLIDALHQIFWIQWQVSGTNTQSVRYGIAQRSSTRTCGNLTAAQTRMSDILD